MPKWSHDSPSWVIINTKTGKEVAETTDKKRAKNWGEGFKYIPFREYLTKRLAEIKKRKQLKA